ncbi:Dipeptidase 3 [Portunus trituberculatus]|uniref:Dipeptidase n=1 Tax=Portunus trituberculatus TaxID=210409 RepID=A0A5B7FAV5_PORTR|nr:Dipeptidase 3 [Portunus trituberculatus]
MCPPCVTCPLPALRRGGAGGAGRDGGIAGAGGAGGTGRADSSTPNNAYYFTNATPECYTVSTPTVLTPVGLEDVSKYPMLLAAVLQEPGWSDEDVAKLAGGNFLRVLRRAEQVLASRLNHSLCEVRFSVLASSRKICLSCAVEFKASFVRMKGLSAVMNQLQKLLSPGEKTSFLYAIVDCSDPSLKQPPRVFEAQGTQGSRRGSGLSGSSTPPLTNLFPASTPVNKRRPPFTGFTHRQDIALHLTLIRETVTATQAQGRQDRAKKTVPNRATGQLYTATRVRSL